MVQSNTRKLSGVVWDSLKILKKDWERRQIFMTLGDYKAKEYILFVVDR
jgi:hypothetical protein